MTASKKKKPEADNGVVAVGNVVFCVKNNDRVFGICHAIDSRIEEGRIIEEVKVLVTMHKGSGDQFFVPVPNTKAHLFEASEVFAVTVNPFANDA